MGRRSSPRRILLPALLLAFGVCRTAQALEIEFRPSRPEYAAATGEYRAIWEADGDRIVQALEKASGLRMEAGPIQAIVFNGVSNSGYHRQPMRMRADLPPDTKRATLVHELCHRLVADIVPDDVDEHPVIDLFLYDVWVELWGRKFADEQLAVESGRRGRYDYESAWRWAMALGKDGRAERWSKLLRQWSAS